MANRTHHESLNALFGFLKHRDGIRAVEIYDTLGNGLGLKLSSTPPAWDIKSASDTSTGPFFCSPDQRF